ncbi:acetyl-CoA carboxylase biotin carboxyl carrier protein subunit [Polaromonas sp. P1(28)-13]|nr:acetyl-CoA carboxylase biotin carboxyl carrier protein subunit [Polaromonas sp. P1(28)-13]
MNTITVQAEVTGTVWKIIVPVGAAVEEDQELMILESMKMEIPATAPRVGVVSQVLVEEGQAVKEGQDLVIIALG